MAEVFILDHATDDFESFMLADESSMLGNKDVYRDLVNFDPKGRLWTQPSLRAGWSGREATGNVDPGDDYPTVYYGIPAFSQRSVDTLRDLLEPNGELLPLATRPPLGPYYVYNVVAIAEALDPKRSCVENWTVFAQYGIKHHEFISDRIAQLPIFRIPEAPQTVYVNDVFVSRVRKARLIGFRFLKVWPLPYGTKWYQLGLREKDPPEARTPPLAPRASPGEQGSPKVQCRPFSPGAELDSFNKALAEYSDSLGIGQIRSNPDAVARWVQLELERIRRDDFHGERRMERAFWLAVAWGEAVRQAFHWEWVMLYSDDKHKAIAVANPDRSLVAPVTVNMDRLATDPDADINAELLYNMIKSGAFSPAPPGQLRVVG